MSGGSLDTVRFKLRGSGKSDSAARRQRLGRGNCQTRRPPANRDMTGSAGFPGVATSYFRIRKERKLSAFVLDGRAKGACPSRASREGDRGKAESLPQLLFCLSLIRTSLVKY